jgi:hypothetical protein
MTAFQLQCSSDCRVILAIQLTISSEVSQLYHPMLELTLYQSYDLLPYMIDDM